MAQIKWKILESEMIVNEENYKLRCDKVQFQDGNIEDYFVSMRPDVVVVFAVINEEKVLVVRQYKHAVGKFTLELPAGMVQPRESPRKAAHRELMEETGYTCRKLIKLGKLLDDSSKNNNHVHLFMGIETKRVSEKRLDLFEKNADLKVQIISLEDLFKKIRSGRINAQSSVSCSLVAFDYLNSLGINNFHY